MAWQFTQKRRVHFAETDLAGIAHFSNFFRWMEETEHAFYRSLGLSVHPLQHEGNDASVGWPRVKATCDYRAPLRFEEEMRIDLLVAEVRSKSIRYRFHFFKGDGTHAATGELVVVSVTADPETRRMRAAPIPPAFSEKIQAAPEDSSTNFTLQETN